MILLHAGRTNSFTIPIIRDVMVVVSSLYSSFSQVVTAIRSTGNVQTDMIASLMNFLMLLVPALPVLLVIMLVLTCAGLGSFIIRLTNRDKWEEEDEVSLVRRRNMTILACIGVDLFVIAYVGVIFFLLEFLVDHVDILR